ncbi:MAG: biotin--[acetyl-CoA-carboxylase] ligase [Oligosphaeraceae bacterium]|nr:biotin--[acetyl-CoA-carboxylase] ligase [Oligosphaeraceae bacterium]
MSAPTPDNVFPLLSTSMLGRQLIYEQSVPSTNRLAAELAERGAPEGLLVVAERQPTGRGRQDRSWFSAPEQNLTFSLLLRPTVPSARIPEIALLAALALHSSLKAVVPELVISLKWPNDLLFEGKKLCGILCESAITPEYGLQVVVGIGLNVNCPRQAFPPELQLRSTSLRMASGEEQDRSRILAEFLNQFEPCYQHWLQDRDLGAFLPAWQAADLLYGRNVTLDTPAGLVSGQAQGISPDGRLRLRLPDGRLTLVSCGDAHLAPLD